MRGRIITPDTPARSTCWECMRPTSHCLCRLVPPFKAHCQLTILQHPNEWRKYYSTVKLIKTGVLNARVLRGIEFESAQLEQVLPAASTYLLYPSKEAIDCEELDLDAATTIVAIDGTWDEAGKIMHRNPYLRTLRHVTFKRPLRSQYQIRKQPRDGCLSTLEAVAHMLKLNATAHGQVELASRYDALFAGFEQMVQRQLQYFPRMRALAR